MHDELIGAAALLAFFALAALAAWWGPSLAPDPDEPEHRPGRPLH